VDKLPKGLRKIAYRKIFIYKLHKTNLNITVKLQKYHCIIGNQCCI